MEDRKIILVYVPEKKWNGKCLTITAYKPHQSEVRNYNAKETYYIHAVYEYSAVFLGRFFNRQEAINVVLTY